jgi:hypothetical protein
MDEIIYDSLYSKCQISTIQKDKKVGASIKVSIYGLTTRQPNIYYYKNKESKEKQLLKFLLYHNNINSFDALIDVGGLIVMNSVNNIVNIIYEHMQKTYIIKN